MSGQAGATNDELAIEITDEMIDAVARVFCENGSGMPISRFDVQEIRDLMPEALSAVFNLAKISR